MGFYLLLKVQLNTSAASLNFHNQPIRRFIYLFICCPNHQVYTCPFCEQDDFLTQSKLNRWGQYWMADCLLKKLAECGAG